MARVGARYGLGTIVTIGIIAGLLFAAFEMLAAAILMGPGAATMPLRMIGAMLLGPAALDPGYLLPTAAMTGVVVHMVLSILFTGIFAAIAQPIGTATGAFLSTQRNLALGGIVFGVALWLVNFYLVAPLAGWSWFPEQTDPAVQFVAHAFFFGAPVGWMLGRSRAVLGPTL